ncbi:MAG: ribonuclease HI [Candidatus Sumerlaeia bacterium]|nr:ribonuclease HI [Candidatus Sumerlaeia bacterium]
MPRKSKPIIEFAKPGDEEEICRLIHALAKYEKEPESCVATPEMVREQLFGDKPGAECLLASMDGRVVGFALFFPSFSTWLCKPGMYLEDVFVEPEARELGIGGMLLQRLANICAERDYGRLEWACLEWNELAKGFYRRIGARPMEEWRTWRLTGEPLAALAKGSPAEKKPKEKKAEPASDKVEIYTDGGCRPNPGVGAWAAVLLYNGKTRELVGGEDETTNNRMEMLASISALETLKRPCKVVLHTDSQYLKNGITSWISKWKRNGWMTATKKPVKNDDLWKRLDAVITKHDIEWAWVRGHSGDKYNERCDELCTEEIDRRCKSK